jgi:hypothetical protein
MYSQKRTAHEAGINGNNAAHEQRLKQAKSEVMPEPTKPAAPMQIPKVSVTLAVEPPATAPVASLAEQPESANILNGVGGLWVVRSIYVPRKSLRGNVSPATISSALSHTNRWTVRPLNEATPPPVNRLLQRNSSNLSVSSMGSTNSSPSASDEETAKRKPMRVSQWQVRS